MAGSMNKVILIGRLGQDPKLSYTQAGHAVTNFTMATDEGYKDRNSGQRVERTEWHRVVCWRQAAEFVSNYLSKGSLVLVEGKLQTRKWQDQNGQDRYTTEIIADSVSSLESRRDNSQGGYQQQSQQSGYQQSGYQQSPQGGQASQQGAQQAPEANEDLGPAFPSEASGMDDVPF